MDEEQKQDRIDQIVRRRQMLGHTRTFVIETLRDAERDVERARSSVRSVEDEDARLADEYTKLMGWV